MKSIDKKLRIFVAYNEPASKEIPEDLDYISEVAVKNEAEIVYKTILQLGHIPSYLGVKDIEDVLNKIKEYKPDLLFNLCEGYRGNAKFEMYMAGLWELLGIPYTGNPPIALGIAQNKILAKKLFQANNISTPIFQVYTNTPENTYLNYPLIAKPSNEDASLGVTQHSIINDSTELKTIVADLLDRFRQPILVEQFIQGREFNISILGNNPLKVLPISEISFSDLEDHVPHITSYEAKWLPEHPLYQKTPAVCPAAIDNDLKQRLVDVAQRVYKLLMGRDYGRVDTRVDSQGEIFVLEYNPNPDISVDAGYARALTAAGIQYQEFVDFLINQTMSRIVNG